MPVSEIDDIFAGKFKSATKVKDKGKQKAASLGTVTIPAATANKKKRKRRNGNDNDGETSILDDTVVTYGAAEPSTEPLKKKKSKRRSGDKSGRGEGEIDAEKIDKARTPGSGSKPTTRVVETVQDPSAGVGLSSKASAATAISAVSTKSSKSKSIASRAKTKKTEENDDDLKRFKDSRGTGPRKRTEEGWLVYNEDELGMDKEGGDTPLCPFDCDCCF